MHEDNCPIMIHQRQDLFQGIWNACTYFTCQRYSGLWTLLFLLVVSNIMFDFCSLWNRIHDGSCSRVIEMIIRHGIAIPTILVHFLRVMFKSSLLLLRTLVTVIQITIFHIFPPFIECGIAQLYLQSERPASGMPFIASSLLYSKTWQKETLWKKTMFSPLKVFLFSCHTKSLVTSSLHDWATWHLTMNYLFETKQFYLIIATFLGVSIRSNFSIRIQNARFAVFGNGFRG